MKKILFILTGFAFVLAPLSAQDSGAGPVKEITITNKGFQFIPAEIKVKQGERVKITYSNSGGFHDVVIDEFNVRTKQIQAGKTDSFEFTPDRKGVFEFYCSVGNHRKMGMFGKLIVE